MSTSPTQLAAVVSSAPELERADPRTHTVAALRQGPSLRKLLGSAGELWTQLQARTRRVHGSAITVTASELAKTQRPARPLRTIEWGLKRLHEAGLITRSRTRYGVVLTLCGWDIDDNGVREYSPHLPPATLRWMRDQRPRGRPKGYKPPASPRPLTSENLFMQQHEVASSSTEARARILAHPLVPPDPHVPHLSLPRLPLPALLSKDARPSENREFLIEAYVSAVRVFYPRLAVASACKYMRSQDGRRLLDAAAEIFLAEAIAPQAWIGLALARDKPRRKQPQRPEILYEPTLIEKAAGSFHTRAEKSNLYTRAPANDARHALYTQGIRDLRALWIRTMIDLKQLDHYDEAAIRNICMRYWPQGYSGVYRSAEEKMRTIQNELDARCARGEYLWGE